MNKWNSLVSKLFWFAPPPVLLKNLIIGSYSSGGSACHIAMLSYLSSIHWSTNSHRLPQFFCPLYYWPQKINIISKDGSNIVLFQFDLLHYPTKPLSLSLSVLLLCHLKIKKKQFQMRKLSCALQRNSIIYLNINLSLIILFYLLT